MNSPPRLPRRRPPGRSRRWRLRHVALAHRLGGGAGRRRDRPRRPQHRAAGQRRRHLGHRPAAVAARRRGVDLRDHRRGHPPLGGDQPARGAAAGAQPGGRAARLRRVRHQRARLQQRHRQQAAGDDRRPHRLFAAVLRRLLGAQDVDAGGRRAHRGHQRSRRHAVGRQRRQRRHQRHHARRRADAGRAGDGPRRPPQASEVALRYGARVSDELATWRVYAMEIDRDATRLVLRRRGATTPPPSSTPASASTGRPAATARPCRATPTRAAATSRAAGRAPLISGANLLSAGAARRPTARTGSCRAYVRPGQARRARRIPGRHAHAGPAVPQVPGLGRSPADLGRGLPARRQRPRPTPLVLFDPRRQDAVLGQRVRAGRGAPDRRLHVTAGAKVETNVYTGVGVPAHACAPARCRGGCSHGLGIGLARGAGAGAARPRLLLPGQAAVHHRGRARTSSRRSPTSTSWACEASACPGSAIP